MPFKSTSRRLILLANSCAGSNKRGLSIGGKGFLLSIFEYISPKMNSTKGATYKSRKNFTLNSIDFNEDIFILNIQKILDI
jgi:hypothetical protein